MEDKTREFPWLPTLLIAWNLFDLIIHLAVDMAEPLRISGNIVATVAGVIVWLGFAKTYAPHLLTVSAVAVVVLNASHVAQHGAAIPMLIFIGVTLYLLLRWAQVQLGGNGQVERFYERAWASLAGTAVGVLIVILSGVIWGVDIVEQTFDGALEGADYWRTEPVILSAGLGFDNIIGVPETNEPIVRDAGGTWYGSMSCTNGEIPDDAN